MLYNLYGESTAVFNIHMVYRMLRRIPLSILLSHESRDRFQANDPLLPIQTNPNLDPTLAMLLHIYGLKISDYATRRIKYYLDMVTRARYILAMLTREKPEDFGDLSPEDHSFLGGVVLKILFGIENNFYYYTNIPVLPSGEADNKIRIGAVLSASLCFINHACLPNACVVWGKGRAKLIALRALLLGEEVTIAYKDIALKMPREARQKQLRYRWGFT